MLPLDCGGCLGLAFWQKLRKMKSEAVENIHVNFAKILHAHLDRHMCYRGIHFLNLNL